jgi:hypothetical protein
MPAKLTDDILLAAVQAVREHGTQRAAAKSIGISNGRLSERLTDARKRGLYIMDAGQIAPLTTRPHNLPPKGTIKRYILTCAQNYTRLHQPVWKNLRAYADHIGAEIMVSTFKYNKDAQGQRAAAKYETRDAELKAMYPQEIIPFVCDERVDIAPNITWCGELNVLPTAVNPLEGLEAYTYRKSTIVPHPKLALESVPAMPGVGVKLMMTTGCVTQRNYIKRKVGYKAEHFHSYGALLVEINDAGSWWCRQLQQGNDGAIYDVPAVPASPGPYNWTAGGAAVAPSSAGATRIKDGNITGGHRVEDIAFGDIHSAKLDLAVAAASWGPGPTSMIEVLRPKSTHVHDLFDGGGRSHHTRKDPHAVFKSFIDGKWGVVQELQLTARVLWEDIARPWCETWVVNSNHDRHLERWLKESDWRLDPENARTVLALNLRWLDAIAAHETKFNLLEHALRYIGSNTPLLEQGDMVQFLAEDESHIILPKIDGGIEGGLHGDRGSNGSKGTIVGISRVDRKQNCADKHTGAIVNHTFWCGLSGTLNQGYNHGLSSWTQTHTLTYPNGTRTLVSLWKGKWRA